MTIVNSTSVGIVLKALAPALVLRLLGHNNNVTIPIIVFTWAVGRISEMQCQNTIIAGNTADNGSRTVKDAKLSGYNLIQNTDGCTIVATPR